MTDHEMFMSKALDEARGALRRGEVPVGCVLVYAPESPKGSETVLDQSKRILGVGSNRTNELKNATMHAEVVCINAFMANRPLDPDVFRECDIYVTCEPCIMCAAALSTVGVRHVYFGCCNDRFGGNGSILSVHKAEEFGLNHSYEVTSGIGKEEAVDLFKQFYSQENTNAPEPKRRKKGDFENHDEK